MDDCASTVTTLALTRIVSAFCAHKEPANNSSGTSASLFMSLEVQAGAHRKATRACCRRDTPESRGIDISVRIPKVRMVEYVHCINPKFQILRLGDAHALD